MRTVTLGLSASAVLLVAMSASVHADFHASTDRFGYTGEIVKYAALSDALTGTNRLASYDTLPSVPARPQDPNGRDVAIYFVSDDSGFDTWKPFLFETAWYYSLTGSAFSGSGNPNNTSAGFVQLYDDSPRQTVTSATAHWTDANLDTFYLKIDGENAGREEASARLWHGPGTGYSGVDEGGFLSYSLEMVAELPDSAVWDSALGYYVYDSFDFAEEPVSVDGSFTGIFKDTTATGAGFYTFDLTLDMNSWAFEQPGLANQLYYTSFGATRVVPEPSSLVAIWSGLALFAAVWVRRRWRNKGDAAL